MKRIAINGFGRIGRMFFRLASQNKNIDIIAINDIADIEVLVHLLKYDSIHGIFNEEITVKEDYIELNGKSIHFYNESDIEQLNWSILDVDIVIESSGNYKSYEDLYSHINAGAKKVILTSPSPDPLINSIVLGVNDHNFNFNNNIISNASCTTHSAAPLIDLIDQNWEIKSAYITTVHSFTNDQNLHDSPHQDFRRARAAHTSIIPTTTGAAKALTRIFPKMKNKIGGCGIRVPIPNGSLTDLTCIVNKFTNKDQVNEVFFNAQNKYLHYTKEPLVSVDILGTKYSSIFDSGLTSVIGNMVKVVAWYDNESGYSYRLIDLINKIN
ncbi:MAG: type I glyceraldehyde-3-phosphate dehydrogenase [Flavobacteriales bacterium]|nr:type I glyceraldehyde-3-phosphate dehydrogenase [Flavobacteriales bacterium]